jgi:opacity protein-like surface antigen
MKEEWKKQMQQKMADYRESDIEVSWDEIEKALSANRKQATIVPLRMKRVAAAAAFLLLAGGGYWMLQQQQTDTPETSLTSDTQTPHSEFDSPSTSTHEEAAASVNASSPIHNFVAQAIAAVKAEVEAEQTAIIPEINDTLKPQVVVAQSQETKPQSDGSTSSQPQETTSQPQASTTQHHEVGTQQLPPLYPSDLRKSASSQPRLTAKVYLSNTMAGGSLYNDNINKLAYNTDWQQGNDIAEKGEKGDKGEIDNGEVPNDNSSYMTISEHVEHHQPIRFGFSLRYRLDDRWSVESGITYTRLTADITTTADGQATATEQRLNYIGIPLNVSYQMWGSRYFNFYLSAGGLVEKMVKGCRTTKGVSNSVNIHPLQVSVNGALGAEFKFIDNLSLYAEPSLNYYFDNGSAIPTFYQEKPLNFNLNVGLRFNIK